MLISFRNSRLDKLINSQVELVKSFGQKVAKAIILRRDLLHAVNNLSQVPHTPPEKLHELKGNRKGQFAVYTAPNSGVRVVFKPDHDPVPTHPHGGIDRKQVTDIVIWEIGDYHDG